MNKLINLYKEKNSLLKQYKFFIVANVRGKTGDYKNLRIRMANQNEFFSDEEFCEIYKAIQQLNVWTKIYYNELDLIYDLLDKEYDLEKLIVFNFARNGCIEGKKSLIPSFCDLLNIKYTSNNAFVQSLCRNKYIWGNVLSKEKLPVLENILICNDEILNNQKPNYKSEYISKPISESSSIGVTLDKFSNVLSKSNKNNKLIAQPYLNGIEFEIPFFELNDEYFILNPTKIVYENDILNEKESLYNNYHYEEFELPSSDVKSYKDIVKKVAQLLGIKKYGRIDFKMDSGGKAYIIDIATLPYITKNSSFYFQVKKNNFTYESIFQCLIVCALLGH